MSKSAQYPERFLFHALLAFSGGFQDAYTYIGRGKVFANAQTGNLVLMSMNLLTGEVGTALRYLLPLLAFASGVFAAERILSLYKDDLNKGRRRIILTELILLAVVAFLPHSADMPANMIVSFTCAMQVEGFRSAFGNAYASTMIIGNLRSGVDALSVYLRQKDEQHRKSAGFYFTIIQVFALGAGIGGNLTLIYDIPVILVSVVCILLANLTIRTNTK